MVVEYPTTVSSVTLNHESVVSPEYELTYSVSSTSNTYKIFGLADGFDADAKGDLKKFDLQLLGSATNPSGTVYVKIYPANYYITNDGNIVLGVEKDQNDDTTSTFGLQGSTSFVIA